MTVRTERFPSGGGAAYLTSSREGPVLLWLGPGTRVSFTINRPGAPSAHVEAPERFGGTPHTWAEFRRFAQRFADAGQERRRRNLLLGRSASRTARRRGSR